jgi:hypothetical protein
MIKNQPFNDGPKHSSLLQSEGSVDVVSRDASHENKAEFRKIQTFEGRHGEVACKIVGDSDNNLFGMSSFIQTLKSAE